MKKLVLSALLLSLVACGDDDDDTVPTIDGAIPAVDASSLEKIECDVAIVGGGAGGVHTAFRLAPTLGDKVCLFEKEAELGGRIHDVPLDPDDDASPRFGTGARRVMEGQSVLFGLIDELDIATETPALGGDLISARGHFSSSKEDFVPFYPGLTAAPPDTETALYDTIRLAPATDHLGEYGDFRSYVRGTVGAAGFDFLHDMSRFRADFEYPLDARGYIDYLNEEWDVCCQATYPVGGMSAFIDGMAAGATGDGARFFLAEPVHTIQKSGAAYVLLTDTHEVHAAKVVIAVPPVALAHIDGDVAERIKAQPQFQDIIEVKVVTITQWWPTAWWLELETPAGDGIWRAYTTEQCLSFMEFPLDAYGIDQKATRTVYDDDRNCVEFWAQLAREGTEAVEAEIARELDFMFLMNGVTTPATVKIPEPVKTHVQIWPDAWHWLRASSAYTNADIFAWAVEPLAGEPVGLVGEAYNPQRSGWSDGAYKSSIKLLNEKYGLDLADGSAKPGQRKRATRGQGGH